MKVRTLRYVYGFIMIFGLLTFFTSCEPDDNTQNNPEDARDKFSGSWMCTEQSGIAYPVVISKITTTQDNVSLANFHHFGNSETVSAGISGYSMTLPQQNACSGLWVVKGSGLMTSDKKSIVVQYTVSDGAEVDTINATYNKQ